MAQLSLKWEAFCCFYFQRSGWGTEMGVMQNLYKATELGGQRKLLLFAAWPKWKGREIQENKNVLQISEMEITVQKYAIIIKLQKPFPETRRHRVKAKF